jgi:aryl-alcohol dehydrogenase-like predicted oxidoreductase/enamine deaminase RidA (YjgF/YER057c/UK114 family)
VIRPERLDLAPGLSISRVLTGLWQLADMERDGRPFDRARAARAMTAYADAGFTTFDMADHYGAAEEVAGAFRASRAHPAGVELFTKWVPGPRVLDREQVRTAVRRSLDRLGVDRLDLLQFHAWSYAHPEWLDCLFWLDELRAEGLIARLGLTNFDAAHLRIVVSSGIPIVSNQVCLSLLDRRATGAMSAYCRESGVKLLVYGTLAGGFLSERWLGRPEPEASRLETWSQMKYFRFIRAAGGWERFQRVLAAADGVARRHEASIANVACRHALDHPAVAGVIIGARLGEREHVDDNLRLGELRLDDRDRSSLDRAIAGLDPIPGEPGDEYRRPPFLTASGDLSHHLDHVPPAYPVLTAADGTSRVVTGTEWERVASFSRAIRIGSRILVSGTTATRGNRPIGGADPAAQLHAAIDRLDGAIQSLGGRLDQVVRTRVFVRDLADWEAVARAHGERFGGIGPANTLVQAGLVGEDYKVEIEAEAEVR